LPQAILLARRQARENDERYKERFGWGEVVWTELRSETIGEDYYRVVLQFSRPQRGILEAQTGEEEFLFDLTGILQDRQVLLWPEGLQMGEPERPPQTSGEEHEVAQAVTEKVREFEFLRQWGLEGDGLRIRIAVDEVGNVYVLDFGNCQVQVFDGMGRYLRQWGTEGTGDGQFRDVAGIALDRTGNVYVLDTGNQRVQVFAPFKP